MIQHVPSQELGPTIHFTTNGALPMSLPPMKGTLVNFHFQRASHTSVYQLAILDIDIATEQITVWKVPDCKFLLDQVCIGMV